MQITEITPPIRPIGNDNIKRYVLDIVNDFSKKELDDLVVEIEALSFSKRKREAEIPMFENTWDRLNKITLYS